MGLDKRVVGAQLQIGDSELPTFTTEAVLRKIEAAEKLAGLTRLLFMPSRDADLNRKVLAHCRARGVEAYLWYNVLNDNDIMPEPDELAVDAFGGRRVADTATWRDIGTLSEPFAFSCPANEKYAKLILAKCERLLPDYDGLFIDYIGYPLPSLGLESMFTCFCDTCMKREPRLKQWRANLGDLRDRSASWNDADLEKLHDFRGVQRAYGFEDFNVYRMELITRLVGRFGELARGMGKGFGVDVVCPALAVTAGHDFAALGAMADWLKPRIYLSTYGPSSLPLEYYCLGMGIKTWAKGASIPAVMDMIGRSMDMGLPDHMHRLTESYFSHETARIQIERSIERSGGTVYPGVEMTLHPDYETFLNGKAVAGFVDAASRTPGLVMSWNLLFMPDEFMRRVGELPPL